jgi:beta-phosphoglucomutase
MVEFDRPIGVLWDMDGVITDSGEAHYTSWRKALAKHGLSFSREFFEKTFGMNNKGILSLLYGREATEKEVDTIAGLKEALFRQDVVGNLKPLPGVIDWLLRFERAGARQAVASSAPQENIDAIIDDLNLRKNFQALVSGSNLPGKPDPATFLHAAERLGVYSSECLVIEDATVGIEAARRAGMKCLAVCTTHPKEELQEADIIVERLDDLLPVSLASLFPKSISFSAL